MIYLAYVLGGYTLLCFWLIYGRGPFGFAYNGVIARLLRKIGMKGITIGSTCFVSDARYLLPDASGPGTPFWKHEHHHYRRQWCVLGPFFPPVYLVLLAVKGYDKHPLEQSARRAAGQPER